MGKHTPPAEQRRLVDLWRSSDDSMAGFARAHGVLPGTFATWVTRHRNAPATPGFLRLALPRDLDVPADRSQEPLALHVEGVSLRFESPPSPAWFASVLRELASC